MVRNCITCSQTSLPRLRLGTGKNTGTVVSAHGKFSVPSAERPMLKLNFVGNLTEIDQSLSLLWRNNINPGNIVMGLAFYGSTFQLVNSSCTIPGCSSLGKESNAADILITLITHPLGPARAGPCTNDAGMLSYSGLWRI
jgi:hypothetical protein